LDNESKAVGRWFRDIIPNSVVMNRIATILEQIEPRLRLQLPKMLFERKVDDSNCQAIFVASSSALSIFDRKHIFLRGVLSR
jgi:excisionase family DNA binding protein